MTGPAFAAFARQEHEARLARARRALDAEGCEVCVAMAPETLFYLGGYDAWVAVNCPQGLVFGPGGDEPTLLVRDVDVAMALETTWLSDVRTYRVQFDDPIAILAQIAREKGLRAGRAAVESVSYAMPHRVGMRLAEALAPAALHDASRAMGDLRLVKTPAEMACMEEAARFTALGLDAARAACKPGMTEIELAAEIEYALRRAGCDFWAIPIELSSGFRTPGGHATPREKRIGKGELVHVEFAGVARRYHVAACHTFALGDPGAKARELYQAARESLQAGLAATRPGAVVHDIEEASLVPLRARGLEARAQMRFGYGIGVAYPPIWLETLEIKRGSDQRLGPGMCFVLHAFVSLADEPLGVLQGGTWTMDETGPRQLAGGGDVPLEIL